MPQKKLTELSPDWSGPDDAPIGVYFDCPCCEGSAGHSILVPWSGVSPFPSGAMWQLVGSPAFESLTLRPSVDCTPGGCSFHGFVTDGVVSW